MHKRYLKRGAWLLVWTCCFQACVSVRQKGTNQNDDWVQALAFEYLKINAKASYQDHTHRSASVHIKLRIKKDCMIWFSVSAPWGLEILRGTITPTNITLLNHMQQTYYTDDYTNLRTLWPGPWDYALLQALLLGELPHTSTPCKVIQHDTQQILLQQEKTIWPMTHLINPALRKAEKLIAVAQKGNLVALYSLFKTFHGGLLYRKAILTWYYHATPEQPAMTLTLKDIRPQWPQGSLRFPLAIPAHYEKKHTILDW
ncbi:MAG: DUF4292 domain-containing protein [Bacteroidota bacterium]